MENLIKTNIHSFCSTYKLNTCVYKSLMFKLDYDIDKAIDIIHDIILTHQLPNIPDVAYTLLSGTTELRTKTSIDSVFKFLNKQKRRNTIVESEEDLYTMLNCARMMGFSDRIACRHFLDIYLPYKEINVPFNRNKPLLTRYTSLVKDEVIYVNNPSENGGVLEELNQLHIDLAIQQNGRK